MISVAVIPTKHLDAPYSSAMASPLPAIVVVLVQLIAEEAVDAPAQLFLDVGTQGKPPVRSADRVECIRILGDLSELIENTLVLVRCRCACAP